MYVESLSLINDFEIATTSPGTAQPYIDQLWNNEYIEYAFYY